MQEYTSNSTFNLNSFNKRQNEVKFIHQPQFYLSRNEELAILRLLTRPMTIYLIEDDTIYADFIKKSLSSNAEYTIKAFASAEDGLTALDAALPDVLIIDYKLPGMSGIDLYEKIKSRLKANNKVVMLSSLDDGNMVLNFIQRGVRDYVIKDENVIESLQAVLSGNEDDYYLFN
jgi:DNA-binding NarL/FixJ family response regulator